MDTASTRAARAKLLDAGIFRYEQRLEKLSGPASWHARLFARLTRSTARRHTTESKLAALRAERRALAREMAAEIIGTAHIKPITAASFDRKLAAPADLIAPAAFFATARKRFAATVTKGGTDEN